MSRNIQIVKSGVTISIPENEVDTYLRRGFKKVEKPEVKPTMAATPAPISEKKGKGRS